MSHLRPSPAMVVAIIALIASVTSGAYAAIRITTGDIANGAVTQPKLASNSVWHANIGRRSVRNANIDGQAVTNRNLAANSVWHAQIGTGSVRANNIQPQLLAELQGKQGPAGPAGPTASTAFTGSGTSSAPEALTTTPATAATGTITTTTASQAQLVLNGFVLVRRAGTGALGDTVTCEYTVSTVTNGTTSSSGSFGTVTRGGIPTAVGVEGNLVLAGRTQVGPGVHTVHVSCSASGDGLFSAVGSAFTAIATG